MPEMPDLEPKLRSSKLNSFSLKSPTFCVSPGGISPIQLLDVLGFFEDNGISVSGFLYTLISVGIESGNKQYNDALRDLQKNITALLHMSLAHPCLGGPVLTWAHSAMTTAYTKELQSLSDSDTGWHFTANRAKSSQFSSFSMTCMMSTTATRAPLLWSLFSSLFVFLGDSDSNTLGASSDPKELQYRNDVKKMACISIMANANNRRCNLLQVVIGVFLHTCNAPERAIDLFSRLGLCCSQKSVLGAIDSLSKECTAQLVSAGQSLLVGYAYDNFDMVSKSKTPTVEESGDSLRHLTSGTLVPLHLTELSDLASALSFWEKSRFNDMKTRTGALIAQPFAGLFSLHPEMPDNTGLYRKDRFRSWQFRRDLCEHGPDYFRRFRRNLALPEFVDKVPLFKTQQMPARAMDLPNSSVDGNIATIESLLRQGGLLDTAGLRRRHPSVADFDDFFVLFHGDLGTGERIQTAQIRRSLEGTPMGRLQRIVFVPGLFHIKMACADALWRIFLQPPTSRSDETSFFSLLTTLRPGETSKIANGTAGFQVLNECITHIGRVERLGWWTKFVQDKISDCKSLEEFAEREPAWSTVVEYSDHLAANMSSANLDVLRATPVERQDQQLENTIRRTAYFLLYDETAHAIRSGDVGRVELCLREWIPIFKAVGKHKYSSMLLQFLCDVHFEYPPRLGKAIRYNWFCNISGKEMKFQGIDWLVELNNLLTKTIYGGHGSNNTVDRVIKESVLIQLYREIICTMENQFALTPKLTRHGEPDMTATYAELQRMMKERRAFDTIPGRKSAHIIRDFFEDGSYKLSTETSVQTAEILTQSNEAEQDVTDDDIIMEM